jgi:hypothetical protein
MFFGIPLQENEIDRNKVLLVIVWTGVWFVVYFVVRYLVMNVFCKGENY